MVFEKETFKVADGLLQKTYEIIDEAKACELAIQRELIEAIRNLTRTLNK